VGRSGSTDDSQGIPDDFETRASGRVPEAAQSDLAGVGISFEGTWLQKLFDLSRSRRHKLFAYAEIESEELWQRIANNYICRRWWAHMKDLMITNDDDSPTSVELAEVFHIA